MRIKVIRVSLCKTNPNRRFAVLQEAQVIVCIIAALLVFSGASPWEGAAATAPEGELPGNGRYVATNSFPRNTVVDITNIETNKTTRVIVAGSLDTPGLLAVVSREAAEIIGMRAGSISRIKMVQPSDPIAYLRFTEGLASNIPDYDSGDVKTEENYLEDVNNAVAVGETPDADAVNDETPSNFSENKVTGASGYFMESEWASRNIVDFPGYNTLGESFAARSDKPEAEKKFPAPEEKVDEARIDSYTPAPAPTPENKIVEQPAEYAAERPTYSLAPAQERPPSGTIYGIDPADIIPAISYKTPEREPVKESAVRVTESFSVPRIYELERGRYYVQIAALSLAESVENAVKLIDRSYKPVVYKDGDPWYRILLGPMNQGESAAVLQRFKSTGYKDAFIRQGK